jgi:hypothetical protein
MAVVVFISTSEKITANGQVKPDAKKVKGSARGESVWRVRNRDRNSLFEAGSYLFSGKYIRSGSSA